MKKDKDNIVKQEKGEKYYNNVYLEGGNRKKYFKHYSETPYISIWRKALMLIKQVDKPKILDIGCGVGQFANLLFDNKLYQYKGIDFSKEAVRFAKERNEKYKDLFIIDNAYTSDAFLEDYNIVLLLEVLEHLTDDLQIIKRIKKQSKIIFSVPNFNSESHVRYFKSKKDIFERYNYLLNINNIDIFDVGSSNKIYLVDSKRYK